MIFLHRFNTNIKPDKNIGIEIDVRLHNNEVILNHNYSKGEDILLKDCIDNFKDNKIIVDCKESGIEEYVNDILGNKCEYYFLDSQIPDIVRLSKNQNNFIIRKSQYESDELFYKINAPYRWVDWFKFDEFDLEEYLNYIYRFENKEYNIIVSPELYNYEYLDITKKISNYIPKGFSVCTDYPDMWRNI